MHWKPIPQLSNYELNKFNVSQLKLDSGCIVWTGKRFKSGYGKLWVNGSGNCLVHRISYYINFGDPEEKLVCHKCSNPPCLNTDHLYLGNNSDNQKQAFREGTQNQTGSNNNASKLTEKDVEEIRYIHRSGLLGYILITKKYKVNSSLIAQIVRRKIWK